MPVSLYIHASFFIFFYTIFYISKTFQATPEKNWPKLSKSQATAILSKQFNYVSKESMLSLNMKRFVRVNSILGDKGTVFLFYCFLVNKLKL